MLRSLAFAALLGASSVLAVKCSLDSKCPEDSPCCSQYGECGVGAFCLGGCDPRMSFSLDACMPAPVCKDKKMKLDSLDRIVDISEYLGDADKADWVSQGEPTPYKDSVLLTMPKGSVGTVLASAEYMWYGNVKARFKTSRGRGVVTAFILLSDVKDEIDYEFVGVDLETAQTNFYFQGIPNYENSANISLSDTFRNYHEYEVRWTPDKIEWLVDGQTGRTVDRKDTWNKTSNQWEFPQTPARVQLSIWPGGLESNAKGTIDWAGGLIDWDHEDIKNVGYFYTAFSDVEIECYQTDTPPGTNSGKSYTFSDAVGTNDTVVDGDKDTVLASFSATGLDPDKGKKKDDDKKDDDSKESKTSSSDKPKETQAQVPGGGNGASGQDHSDGQDKNTSSDSGSSGDSSGGSSGGGGDGGDSGDSSSPADTSNCDTSSFNQDCNSGSDSDSSTDGGDGDGSGSTRSSASALAVIIAGCALFWL